MLPQTQYCRAAPADAVPPEPTTPPPTAEPAPTAEPTAAVPTTTYPTYDAGPAGQVALAFDGSSIVFWGAYPNDGWQYSVESEGPKKVKVKFRQGGGEEEEGDGGEVEFQAKLEGSKIKVEVGD